MLLELRRELKKIGDAERAKVLQGFFKTGKGEYGEGDVFLGITVPESRKIAQKFKDLNFDSVQSLLKSKIHEERLVALLILVENFKKGSATERQAIFDYYLSNTKYINNWDLVDLSADKIVGEYLLTSDRVGKSVNPSVAHENFLVRSAGKVSTVNKGIVASAHSENFVGSLGFSTPPILIKLARSKNIWERRIAMIATYQFIKNNKFGQALEIAEILLTDKHDLIQKAVGWMLREIGKRDLRVEEKFLKKHYQKMPRTMLRYAIEKFPKESRLKYLR